MKTISLAVAQSSLDLKNDKPIKLIAHAVVYAVCQVRAHDRNGAKPNEEKGKEACRRAEG